MKLKTGRKPCNPKKIPNGGTQKVPILKPEDSSPRVRLEPALQHWWPTGKSGLLTLVPRSDPRLRPSTAALLWREWQRYRPSTGLLASPFGRERILVGPALSSGKATAFEGLGVEVVLATGASAFDGFLGQRAGFG